MSVHPAILFIINLLIVKNLVNDIARIAVIMTNINTNNYYYLLDIIFTKKLSAFLKIWGTIVIVLKLKYVYVRCFSQNIAIFNSY